MDKIKISSLLSNSRDAGDYIEISGAEPIEDYQNFHFPEGAVLDLAIFASDEKILTLSGTIEVTYESNCDLCLEPTSDTYLIDVNEDIYPPNYDPNQELYMDSPYYDEDEFVDEDEYLHHNGTSVDITKFINDTVILSLPLVVKCSPDCPGLCSKCGKKDYPDHKCIEKTEKDDGKPHAVRPEFDKLRELL